MKGFKRSILLTGMALLMAGYAHDKGYGQLRDSQDGPPPEAFKACEGKSAGSPAQLVGPLGETVSGICEERGGKLVLRPNSTKSRPGAKRNGPPPEAYKACEGKTAGTPAQMKGPRGETVTGVCEALDGVLALRPDQPPQ